MRCFPYKTYNRQDLKTKKLRRADLAQEFFQILAPSESAVAPISRKDKLLLSIREDSFLVERQSFPDHPSPNPKAQPNMTEKERDQFVAHLST
jgi:hypothetical protein